MFKLNSKCYTHIFGYQLLNGVVSNTVGWNRKSEIKHGGRPTGSTYISAYRQGRNEISNAKPTLLGSSFSTELLFILWYQNGSQKSNMATDKPDVLISQLLGEIETKFQMPHPHCWGPASQWSCCQHCQIKPEVRNKRWRQAYLISDFRFHPTVLATILLRSWTSKMWV